MRRFAVKIYAVLLLMGVVPLIASGYLVEQILGFNESVQRDAIESIERTRDVYRAWVLSEGERMSLLGESLAQLPEVQGEPIDREALERRLKRVLQRYPVLERVELLAGEASVMHVGSKRHRPQTPELTYPEKTWPVRGHPGRKIRAVFAISAELKDIYDSLEPRLTRHRVQLAMESQTEGNSLTDLYQKFYFWMLAVVIVLTVALSLLITGPVTRRVRRLDDATRKVAEGDLTVQVEVKGRDELSRLTEHFNRMVTEIDESRRRLSYLEKMEVWQEVARRLAHEIKNPLTPLLLSIQQLDRTFEKFIPDRPERYRMVVDEVVEIVTEEVDTLRKLVKEFSEFARLPAIDPEPTDVRVYLRQFFRLNPQYEDQALLDVEGTDEDAEPLWVRLDQTLMKRVLANILDNGIEAVEPTGREPELRVYVVEPEGEDDLVRIVIEDNGAGVEPELLERLFEPYFTTKEKGTGLGLAIIRKIVLDHGGDIRVSNRDNEPGARVEIELPLRHPPGVEAVEPTGELA